MFKKNGFLTGAIIILLSFSVLIPLNQNNKISAHISEMQNYKFVTLIADGFDYGEMMSIFQTFSIWGCEEPDIAGLEWITTGGDEGYSGEVISDVLIKDLNVSEYDGIIIPGGGGPANLVKNETVLEKIREADAARLILAAICHGPLVLAKAGVVNNTKVTGYDDIKNDLKTAGGIYLPVKAIFDDNIVTGYAAMFYVEFCWCIAKAFGAIEADPPSLKNYDINIISAQYSTKIEFMLNVTDENRIVTIRADIRKQSTQNLFKSVQLTLNNNGFYFGDCAISINGSFFIDIYVEDEYFTFLYYENLTLFNVEVEEKPTTLPNTEETNFSLPLVSLFIIICLTTIYRKRK